MHPHMESSSVDGMENEQFIFLVDEAIPCPKIERGQFSHGGGAVTVRCVGSSACPHRAGTIWGSGPFTTDSPVCICAVYAGLIDSELGGSFLVTPLGALFEYKGGVSNGVETRDWLKQWNGMSLTQRPSLPLFSLREKDAQRRVVRQRLLQELLAREPKEPEAAKPVRRFCTADWKELDGAVLAEAPAERSLCQGAILDEFSGPTEPCTVMLTADYLLVVDDVALLAFRLASLASSNYLDGDGLIVCFDNGSRVTLRFRAESEDRWRINALLRQFHSPISRTPLPVLSLALSYLPNPDLGHAAQSCRLFHAASKAETARRKVGFFVFVIVF